MHPLVVIAYVADVRALFIAVSCVCMIGCSSAKHSNARPFGHSRTYPVSTEEAWGRVVNWFSRNGLPIGTRGAMGTYVATEFDLDASQEHYCDCGKSEERRQIVGNFSVAIEGQGDSTRVAVAATYRASLVSQSSAISVWICPSTGELERSLLAFIGTP